MKRITKKAWFGKKIIGWSIRPVSLEGWLITIVFTIAVIVNQIHNKRNIIGYFILAVILIIFFIIVYLTGDIPGSESRDRLETKKSN